MAGQTASFYLDRGSYRNARGLTGQNDMRVALVVPAGEDASNAAADDAAMVRQGTVPQGSGAWVWFAVTGTVAG